MVFATGFLDLVEGEGSFIRLCDVNEKRKWWAFKDFMYGRNGKVHWRARLLFGIVGFKWILNYILFFFVLWVLTNVYVSR